MTTLGDRLLTEAEKAHFMEMDAMFNSAGWSSLTKVMQAQIDAIPLQAFYNAKSFEELQLARVRMQEMSSLVQLPLLMERSRDELIRERANAADELIAGTFSNE